MMMFYKNVILKFYKKKMYNQKDYLTFFKTNIILINYTKKQKFWKKKSLKDLINKQNY